MAKRPRGLCAFCGRSYAVSGIGRHFQSCAARAFAIEAADSDGDGEVGEILHLKVRAFDPYWLELEVRGDATLRDLDHFMRALWMEECCWHMSIFVGRAEISDWIGELAESLTGLAPDQLDEEDAYRVDVGIYPMAAKVSRVFDVSDSWLMYQYDMGTTTSVEFVRTGTRRGHALSDKPIFLVARNDAPRNARAPLQDRSINSPRWGVCGYDGPADPPY